MTVHDDDAEWLRSHAKYLKSLIGAGKGTLFFESDLEKLERIASRISPTIAEGVLRRDLRSFFAALDDWIELSGKFDDQLWFRVKRRRAALEGNTLG